MFICQFPQARNPSDESRWAEQVVSGLKLQQGRGRVFRITPSAADFAADLERVLHHQEAPFADTSVCSHFALMRGVRERGVKVLLSGQGGDEVFAGYPSYFRVLLGQLLATFDVAALWHEARTRARRAAEPFFWLLGGAAYHALPDRFRYHLYKRRRHGGYPLSAEGLRQLESAPIRFGGPLPGLCGPPAAQWSYFDVYLLDCVLRFSLPHVLRHDDRNSMAFGVESRAPYLDYRLTELLLTVEPRSRIGDGYTKRLLREVAAGLLPEPVRLRVDKLGFFSPQLEWLWSREDDVRAACARLPAELLELTAPGRLHTAIDDFYRRRRRELSSVVWTGFVCSLFLSRVLPQLTSQPKMA